MISNTRLVISSTALLALTSTSFGFAEFARGGLLLDTNASVMYDSFFLGSADNDPDTIYTLYPALRFVRRAGLAQFTASGGVAFNRHEVNKDYDSDDLRINVSLHIPSDVGSRLTGDVSVGYTEDMVVDYSLNDRIPTERYFAQIGLTYPINPGMILNESLSYSSVSRAFYSDQDMFSNRLHFTYRGIFPGTSLLLGHELTITKTDANEYTQVGLDQYSNNLSIGLSRPLYGEVSGSIRYGYSVLSRSSEEVFGSDTSRGSHYLNISIDGPFLPANRFPKLTSSASISYSQSSVAGFLDDGGKFLSGSLRLAWSARERTDLSIHASRSMELSANNLAVENTRVGGGFTQKIGRVTKLDGSISYNWRSYRGVTRDDTILQAGLTLSRPFTRNLHGSLSYGYVDNNTDALGNQFTRVAPRNYERHTVTGSATFTF